MGTRFCYFFDKYLCVFCSLFKETVQKHKKKNPSSQGTRECEKGPKNISWALEWGTNTQFFNSSSTV